MSKVIKGSALYADDGTYIFTPYEEGKPENQVWVPLANAKYGKMECSKKKLRIVLTIDRQDESAIFSALTKSAGSLLSQLLNKRVQSIFRKAESMNACDVYEQDQSESEQEHSEEEIHETEEEG